MGEGVKQSFVRAVRIFGSPLTTKEDVVSSVPLKRGPASVGHAKGAVDPDHAAVEHLVVRDVLDERGELGRRSEPAGERDGLSQRLLQFVREAGRYRGPEHAG